MHTLSQLLPDGVAPRGEVVRFTSSSSVARWLSRGDLVPVQPGVLALAERAGEWEVRARAAALWSGAC
ncbi:hypothetical protein [Blastococcus brunescens]|uniref:Uncharacterized protein n=1 Tax=Blastococcus brunescens TaxID=1564165 RepID=A0ABZ1B3V3_9ACTN|nr:hypothetical protein [Blastococcus sp. BMG 8361]WRL65480.1 hypothetical protein U6N30_07655 [Blastococcus sp. BMG 8361]